MSVSRCRPTIQSNNLLTFFPVGTMCSPEVHMAHLLPANDIVAVLRAVYIGCTITFRYTRSIIVLIRMMEEACGSPLSSDHINFTNVPNLQILNVCVVWKMSSVSLVIIVSPDEIFVF